MNNTNTDNSKMTICKALIKKANKINEAGIGSQKLVKNHV